MGSIISHRIDCNGVRPSERPAAHTPTKNWIEHPLNLFYILFVHRGLWRYDDDSLLRHWSAIATEISQNNINLAKTKKSLLFSGLQFVVAMATSWGNSVHDSWCCLFQRPIHRISVQKRGRFPFFGRANNSVAGFAMYFHRYLHSCFTECSTVPRLQGNSISAHVCSFILDSGSSSHPRLVSIHQLIHFYRVFIISGHNFFLDSKLYSQNFGCRISKLHQVKFFEAEWSHLRICYL